MLRSLNDVCRSSCHSVVGTSRLPVAWLRLPKVAAAAAKRRRCGTCHMRISHHRWASIYQSYLLQRSALRVYQYATRLFTVLHVTGCTQEDNDAESRLPMLVKPCVGDDAWRGQQRLQRTFRIDVGSGLRPTNHCSPPWLHSEAFRCAFG